jgi:hypothetical protein
LLAPKAQPSLMLVGALAQPREVIGFQVLDHYSERSARQRRRPGAWNSDSKSYGARQYSEELMFGGQFIHEVF